MANDTHMQAKTPGHNRRLTIWFACDKNGRKNAYYWSFGATRAIRMNLGEAELAQATDTADIICCHPFKECTHK